MTTHHHWARTARWIVGGLLLCALLTIAWLGGDSLHAARSAIYATSSLRSWITERNGSLGTSGGQLGGAPSAGASSAIDTSPRLPKVALMFLTRGPMPQRAIWATFLSAAAMAAQPELASSPDSGGSSAGSSTGGSFGDFGGPGAQQQLRPADPNYQPQPLPGWDTLFSLYVHPPPGFRYPKTSMFSGHEIRGRVNVTWGQVSEAVAHILLLKAALKDPLNQRFALLSDSCVPLYPPATVYWQLMAEGRSRVNACPREKTSADRYQKGMADFGIAKSDWRKNQQWTVLTRKHAETVVEDRILLAAFARECRANKGFCLASEHYVPVLLAKRGLAAETNCRAVTTYHLFERSAHPRIYKGEEATRATLELMRGEHCAALPPWNQQAKRAIAESLQRVQQQQQQLGADPGFEHSLPGSLGEVGTGASGQQGSGLKGAASGLGATSSSADPGALEVGWLEEWGKRQGQRVAMGGLQILRQVGAELNLTVSPPRCPLFGRKIGNGGAWQWAQLLEPMLLE